VRITVLFGIAVAPVWALLAANGVQPAEVLGLAAAPLALLVFDDVVVRRGRVVLEDLYLYSGEYGPLGGVSPAGVIALACGRGLHPRLLDIIVAKLPPTLAAA